VRVANGPFSLIIHTWDQCYQLCIVLRMVGLQCVRKFAICTMLICIRFCDVFFFVLFSFFRTVVLISLYRIMSLYIMPLLPGLFCRFICDKHWTGIVAVAKKSDRTAYTTYGIIVEQNRRKCRVWSSRGYVTTLSVVIPESRVGNFGGSVFAVCCAWRIHPRAKV